MFDENKIRISALQAFPAASKVGIGFEPFNNSTHLQIVQMQLIAPPEKSDVAIKAPVRIFAVQLPDWTTH